MSDGFVDRLAVELRAAAEREGRRRPRGRAAALAAGLVVIAAVAVALLALRPPAEPEATPPLRVVERLRLTGNPGSLTSAFGSVWLTDNVTGVVLRIDPRTRALRSRVRIGARQPFSVGAGGGALWLPDRDGAALQRIDPRSTTVTRHALRTPAGARFLPDDVAADGEHVWAVGARGALRVDPATVAGLRRADTGPETEPRWAGLAGPTLWILATDGNLHELDATTGAARGVAPTRAAGAAAVLADRSGIVAAGGATLARVRGDGSVRWQRRLGLRVNQIARARGSLWAHVSARRGPDRLVELDQASGRTRSETVLPTFGATGLAGVGAELWLDTPAGDTVILSRQATR